MIAIYLLIIIIILIIYKFPKLSLLLGSIIIIYPYLQQKFTSTHDLIEAAENGNASAKEIWLRSVRQLAIGISSLTNILSPEMVVLGGGIAAAGDALFQPLEIFMEQYEWRTAGNKVKIMKAAHQDLSGAIGAAAFAMQKG